MCTALHLYSVLSNTFRRKVLFSLDLKLPLRVRIVRNAACVQVTCTSFRTKGNLKVLKLKLFLKTQKGCSTVFLKSPLGTHHEEL